MTPAPISAGIPICVVATPHLTTKPNGRLHFPPESRSLVVVICELILSPAAAAWAAVIGVTVTARCFTRALTSIENSFTTKRAAIMDGYNHKYSPIPIVKQRPRVCNIGAAPRASCVHLDFRDFGAGEWEVI